MKEYIGKVLEYIKKYFWTIFPSFYQYVFYVVLGVLLVVKILFDLEFLTDKMILVILGIIYAINTVITLIATVINMNMTSKGKHLAEESAIINLVVKISNTIANLMNCVIILIFLVTQKGVIVIFFSVVTCTALLITGLYSTACARVLKESDVIANSNKVLTSLGSFIIGVDFFIAISYIKKISEVKGNGKIGKIIDGINRRISDIPLLLYPFIIYIVMFAFMAIIGIFDNFEDVGIGNNQIWTTVEGFILQIITIAVNVYVIVVLIRKIMSAKKVNEDSLTLYSVREAAFMNWLIKVSHAPAYLFHAGIFFLGVCLGVFGGIIFIGLAIIMTILPMIVSGLNSISCTILMRKKRIISLPTAIIMGILNCIYFVDVFVARSYVKKAMKYREDSSVSNDLV